MTDEPEPNDITPTPPDAAVGDADAAPSEPPEASDAPEEEDGGGLPMIQVRTLPRWSSNARAVRKFYDKKRTQHQLVFWLLAVVALQTLGAWIAVIAGEATITQAKDLVAVTLVPLFTLLGTAVAFFYRSDDDSK